MSTQLEMVTHWLSLGEKHYTNRVRNRNPYRDTDRSAITPTACAEKMHLLMTRAHTHQVTGILSLDRHGKKTAFSVHYKCPHRDAG